MVGKDQKEDQAQKRFWPLKHPTSGVSFVGSR